jgi:hypothetical protein
MMQKLSDMSARLLYFGAEREVDGHSVCYSFYCREKPFLCRQLVIYSIGANCTLHPSQAIFQSRYVKK